MASKNRNVSLDEDVYELVQKEAQAEDRSVAKQASRRLRQAYENVDVSPETTQAPDAF